MKPSLDGILAEVRRKHALTTPYRESALTIAIGELRDRVVALEAELSKLTRPDDR